MHDKTIDRLVATTKSEEIQREREFDHFISRAKQLVYLSESNRIPKFRHKWWGRKVCPVCGGEKIKVLCARASWDYSVYSCECGWEWASRHLNEYLGD